MTFTQWMIWLAFVVAITIGVMLFAALAYKVWDRWWGAVLKNRWMKWGKSIHGWNEQQKAIKDLASFVDTPEPRNLGRIHFDHIAVDDDGVVAFVAIPKHQLPCGWFVPEHPGGFVSQVEKEDDEVPLSLRVLAGELVNDQTIGHNKLGQTIEWYGIEIELNWHDAQFFYLIWEEPAYFASLRLSFCDTWLNEALEAMRDDAKDRATEMKQGDK